MLSDTIIFYILIILLIYVFGSKIIPQLLIFSLIIYYIYTKVITTFDAIDIIITSLTILYCLSHIVESIDSNKKEDDK